MLSSFYKSKSHMATDVVQFDMYSIEQKINLKLYISVLKNNSEIHLSNKKIWNNQKMNISIKKKKFKIMISNQTISSKYKSMNNTLNNNSNDQTFM